MYLSVSSMPAIWEVPKRKPIKAMFCKHRNTVRGHACSKQGMCRISGFDYYEVCADCGTILSEKHIDYGR